MPARMRRAIAFALASVTGLAFAASSAHGAPEPSPTPRPLLAPGEEKFLANLRQLTFAGQNAEAYWSADGGRLIFQSDEGSLPCDQIFAMSADGSGRRRISNGEGKTTCSYFFPDGERVVYASTFRAGAACPPRPDRSRGYVWALDDYDIYTARADGTDTKPLFASPAYDAEATISPDGKTIVFTSARDGDLEIYTMNADGSGVRRLTQRPATTAERSSRTTGRRSSTGPTIRPRRRTWSDTARTCRGTRTHPGASKSAS